MGTINFKKYDLKDWYEAKQLLEDYCHKNPEEWLFRGMPNSKWELKSTFERIDFPYRDFEIEESLIESFKRRAHHYLNQNELPESDSLIDWMTIMQHYGAPTRLLDWTRSPYIASFFAFKENSRNTECISIWGINRKWLYETNNKILEKKGIESTKNILYAGVDFTENEGLVVEVRPKRDNERIISQQGCFLIALNIHYSFQDNFYIYDKEEMKKNIIKINIPNYCSLKALYDLELMNINYATLFPGLDGYAKSVNHYPISMEIQLEHYDEERIKEEDGII